jgi:hypothetical protein
MPNVPLKSLTYGDDQKRITDTINENFNLLWWLLNNSNIGVSNVSEAVFDLVKTFDLIADRIVSGTLTLTDAMTIVNEAGTVTIDATSFTIQNSTGTFVITPTGLEINTADVYISLSPTGFVMRKGDQTTLIDQYGLDVKFIKWFKNMCYNSSFELFDSTTKLSTYWDGGVSSADSNFFGTYSLKLTAGQTSTQTGSGIVNPQWYNDVAVKTRVSFHKKGGEVKISVLDGDNADAPFTLTDEAGSTGTFIAYASNANWIAQSYTVVLTHGATTQIKVKFENSDGVTDAYIDGVIIEPDYTGKRPSFYTDGPNSVGNSKGGDLTVVGSGQIYVQDDEPTDDVDKDLWVDTNDYSRVDRQAFAATGSDTVANEEFVEFTGSSAISYTLASTGATGGCIKLLKNSSTALVTIVATVDGVANMYLYPGESCKLIWNGTDWRMW